MRLRLIKPKISENPLTGMKLWHSMMPEIPEKHQAMFIPNPRGVTNSKTILVGPVPTPAEYKRSIPFSGEDAFFFHTLLKESGFNTSELFVTGCCRYGLKALKGNTAEILDFLKEGLKREIFTSAILVGADAAKWAINGGKKVNMGYVTGKIMYPPNLSYKPVFVFSDPTGLVPQMTEDSRENYYRRQGAENLARRIRSQANTLSKFMKVKANHG